MGNCAPLGRQREWGDENRSVSFASLTIGHRCAVQSGQCFERGGRRGAWWRCARVGIVACPISLLSAEKKELSVYGVRERLDHLSLLGPACEGK